MGAEVALINRLVTGKLVVKSLYGMFQNASSFNFSIHDWDVKQGYRNVQILFQNANSFNQDIGS